MNQYSARWFELFLLGIAPATTEREVAFLGRQLPLPPFARLLDVCCGPARHARLLDGIGYHVTGIDTNAAAIAAARAACGPRARFLEHDMRAIEALPDRFDAVLLLWQSFGQFDPATNLAILAQIAGKLDLDGRFVLDIYHREFFVDRLAPREHEVRGRRVLERKELALHRLTVTLDYGDGEAKQDRYEWELFTPAEITELCRAAGLQRVLACTGFDEALPPSADQPRMQLVFARA